MCLLQAQSLTTQSCDGTSLKNVNVSVAAGELVGILGPKGAGKRRLLQLLSGEGRPEQGTIRFTDRDVTKLSTSRRSQLGIASSVVQPGIWTRLARAFRVPTVADRLRRSLNSGDRLSRTEQEARIADVLNRFALSNVANHRMDALSAGERSRVQWAALLVRRPKLIVFDEPFRGAEFIAESASYLCRQLTSEGHAILLSQRDLCGIELYDRVYVLDRGDVIAEGTPHEVCRRLDVLKLFAGKTKASTSTHARWDDTPRRAASDGSRTIFISYTRQDASWVDQLEANMAPIVASMGWKIWTDRQIKPGSDWFEEIEQAMNNSAAAILLVSPEYLASEFVTQHELPQLMAAAKAGRLRLLWLPLRPSDGPTQALQQFQALSDPRTPLATASHVEQQRLWKLICNGIGEFLGVDSKKRRAKAS